MLMHAPDSYRIMIASARPSPLSALPPTLPETAGDNEEQLSTASPHPGINHHATAADVPFGFAMESHHRRPPASCCNFPAEGCYSIRSGSPVGLSHLGKL